MATFDGSQLRFRMGLAARSTCDEVVTAGKGSSEPSGARFCYRIIHNRLPVVLLRLLGLLLSLRPLLPRLKVILLLLLLLLRMLEFASAS